MIPLKLAVLATTAAGAVATAGGVTYAAVSHPSDAPKTLSKAAAAAAQHPAPVPSVPSAPTCAPKLPKGKVPSTLPKVPGGKLPSTLPKVPGAKVPSALPKVPGGKVPSTLPKVPGGKLPSTLPKVPGGKLPSTLPKVPGGKLPKLPTCKTGTLPSKPGGLPKLPGKPNLPTKLSCSSVPPAINQSISRGKDFKLPNGTRLTVTHTHSIAINGRQACANIQQFAGLAGSYLTVERIQTPPQTTVQQVVQALKLTGGNIASAGGTETWRSPAGNGMLGYSDKGFAVYVTGSPVYTPMLPGLMSQLQTQ